MTHPIVLKFNSFIGSYPSLENIKFKSGFLKNATNTKEDMFNQIVFINKSILKNITNANAISNHLSIEGGKQMMTRPYTNGEIKKFALPISS